MSSPIVMAGSAEGAGADAMNRMVRAKSFDHRSVVDFFARTRAYDVMPENGKVAIVDKALTLAEALEVLAEHRLGACALWWEETCSGLITPAAICAVLVQLASDESSIEEQLNMVTLEQAVSEHGLLLETEEAEPDTTVLVALQQMHGKNIQLLQIREGSTDCPVFLMSYPRVLRYVMSHFQDAEGDARLEEAIGSLNLASDPVLTLESKSTVLEALTTLAAQKLAFAPVLDEDGVVVGLITPEDLTLTIASSSSASESWLQRTLGEVVTRPEHADALQTCLRTEALLDVLRRLGQSGYSRMVMVDLEGKLEAVVLLEHLFMHSLSESLEGGEEGAESEGATEAPEAEEEEDAVTMQFGRFAVTDFEED